MAEGWIRTDRGWRKRYSSPRAAANCRSTLALPMLVRDFDEPVQSMADGKWYTSKRALARTFHAAHNPHGEDFIELGTEKTDWQEYEPDPAETRRAIAEAVREVSDGTFQNEER